MGWPRGRLGLAGLLLAACAACTTLPEPAERLALAQSLTAPAGLAITRLPTVPPMVAAWAAAPAQADTLTVYLEGDGLAWRTAEWPSADPTPTDPVALRLALRHGAGAVAWLARPCQYVQAEASGCPTAYWTSERYGPATLGLVNQALDLLKARHAARQLVLVGYSGGGAMAALIAARRDDVARLVTVAANLDLDHWTQHHGLPAMAGTENPAALGDRLRRIPQRHFVGSLDKVVPPATVRSYAARLGPTPRVQVRELPGMDHNCCWADQWPVMRTSAFAD